jgi:hypothetical protein
MRRFAMFLLAFMLLLASFTPARAQTPPTLTVSDIKYSYQFGKFLFFQARLHLPSPAKETTLLFHAEGESTTRTATIEVFSEGNTSYQYDMSQGAVRPFAKILYQYRVALVSGEELISEEFSFIYDDNRFPWQMLSQENVNIHWYAGDQTFGQDAMDIALRGMAQVKKLLLVGLSRPLDIYIYASATDLNQALEIGSVPWVGGHASPDLYVGLISVPPSLEQKLDMERKVPHELAHIMTYDLMGERYFHLPVWLREGIASKVELSQNPDYPRALSLASEQKTLIPIADLCESFPPESGRAFLAYAQAQSFTNFIVDNFGQTGLLALTSAYGDGLDCEQGMGRALGQPLSQVEADWRSGSLGENVGLTAFNNLFPYIAILVVLLLVMLVNAFTFTRAQHG